jgi:hypothetical protein
MHADFTWHGQQRKAVEASIVFLFHQSSCHLDCLLLRRNLSAIACIFHGADYFSHASAWAYTEEQEVSSLKQGFRGLCVQFSGCCHAFE